MKTLAVIGGGISGCSAAIESARYFNERNTKCNIVIFESLPYVCKKLLVTGNGRCNILNEDTSPENYHGDPEFIKSVFSVFGTESNKEFLKSIGILTQTEEAGRIYPMSGRASSVREAIERELDNLNIKTYLGEKINSVRQKDCFFILNEKYRADCVIISGGGMSSPAHGSDGSCIEILSSLNLKIKTPVPALTPLIFEKCDKSLKGVRSLGSVSVLINGKTADKSFGELQFTDYGLSGIPAMEVSACASRLLLNKSNSVTARISLVPELSEKQITEFIFSRKTAAPEASSASILSGFMNEKLAVSKLKKAKIPPSAKIKTVGENDIKKLVRIIKNEDFLIKSTAPFNMSQVTSGGAVTDGFHNTMQSKKIPSLFASGEVLDVDGKCGGYNLSWCISSGRTAGLYSAKYIIGEK